MAEGMGGEGAHLIEKAETSLAKSPRPKWFSQKWLELAYWPTAEGCGFGALSWMPLMTIQVGQLIDLFTLLTEPSQREN